MDRILGEIEKLGAGMQRMEQRLADLESQVVALAAEKVETLQSVSADDQSATFIERVADVVQSREERVNFPWMDANLWAGVKEGMSPEEVVGILGEPTMEDPSLHKWVDIVYTYQGRKPATGEKLKGKVKFFRNKVTAIEIP